MSKNKKIGIRLPFIMLFWVVMGLAIGSTIWLIRVLIIIQYEGIHVANEPNPLILSAEIVFLTIGVFLTIIITFKISKLLLEKMM